MIGLLDYIDDNGTTKSSEKLLREYIALAYIALYYAETSEIEFDYTAPLATTGDDDYNSGEQDALDDLFDFDALEECYDKLNIPLIKTKTDFDLCLYEQEYPFPTGVSAFLADDVSKYEEVVPVGGGGITIIDTLSFNVTNDSLVMINGIGIPSTEYTISGTKITLAYALNEGDRVTIIK